MFTLCSYCAPVVDHASYDLQCEYDDCDTNSYIPLSNKDGDCVDDNEDDNGAFGHNVIGNIIPFNVCHR